MMLDDTKDKRIYRLYFFVLSHRYPQKNEAGIAKNSAVAAKIPM
jgi:hypothetical protein